MRIILRKLDRPKVLLFLEDTVPPVTVFYLDEFGLVPTVPPRLVWNCNPFYERDYKWVTDGGPPPDNQTEGYFSTITLSYGRRKTMVIYGDELPGNFTAAPLPGREDSFQPYVKPTVFGFTPSPLHPDDGDSGPVSFSNVGIQEDNYTPYVQPVWFSARYTSPITDELVPPSAPLTVQEDQYIPGFPVVQLTQPAIQPVYGWLLLSVSTPQEEPFILPVVVFGGEGVCAKYGTGVLYGSGKKYCDTTRRFLQYVADPPLLGSGGWGSPWDSTPWGGDPGTTTQSFVNVQRLSVRIRHADGGLFVIARIRPISEDGGYYPWNYEAFSDYQLVQRCSIAIRHSSDTAFVINHIRPIAEVSNQEPIG